MVAKRGDGANENGAGGSTGPHRRLIILVVASSITVATLLVYMNALDAAWVLDDFPRIVENEAIRMDQFSFQRLWTAATSEPGGGRWVTNATFAMNYYLHGLHPPGYHLVNVGVHILTALGLFFFLALLLRSLYRTGHRSAGRETDGGEEVGQVHLAAAGATALLWSVHPVLTQSVNYTTQRGVLLCGLFYVWGLWGFLEWQRRRDGGSGFLLFAVLMSLLAVKSKEIGGTIYLAAGLIYWLCSDEERGRDRTFWILGAGCVLIFCVVSVYLLGGPDGVRRRVAMIFSSEPMGSRRFTVLERVMTEWRVVMFYLSLILYPLPDRLNLEHDIQVSVGLWTPASTGLSLGAILLLLVLAVRCRSRYPVITFGILWFFLQLVVTSSVLNLELIFEHRVYLAAIGPLLVLVDLFYRCVNITWKGKCMVLFLLASLLGWGTVERNHVWQSTLSIYRDAVRKAPEKPRNHGNLGMAYVRKSARVIRDGNRVERAFELMVKGLRHHYRSLEESFRQKRPVDHQFVNNIEPLLGKAKTIWTKIDGRKREPRWTRTLVRLYDRFLYSMPPRYLQNQSALQRQLSQLRMYLAGVYFRNDREEKGNRQLLNVVRQAPQHVDEGLENISDPDLREEVRKRLNEIRANQGDAK